MTKDGEPTPPSPQIRKTNGDSVRRSLAHHAKVTAALPSGISPQQRQEQETEAERREEAEGSSRQEAGVFDIRERQVGLRWRRCRIGGWGSGGPDRSLNLPVGRGPPRQRRPRPRGERTDPSPTAAYTLISSIGRPRDHSQVSRRGRLGNAGSRVLLSRRRGPRRRKRSPRRSRRRIFSRLTTWLRCTRANRVSGRFASTDVRVARTRWQPSVLLTSM